jgi:hypothetical protein
VLGVSQGGESEEGVDRREPGVEGAEAVVAIVLEVVEEPGDARGVEIIEIECSRLLAALVLGEGEQQPEGGEIGASARCSCESFSDTPSPEPVTLNST